MKKLFLAVLLSALLLSACSQPISDSNNNTVPPQESDKTISLQKHAQYDEELFPHDSGCLVCKSEDGSYSFVGSDGKKTDGAYTEIVSRGNGYFWVKSQATGLYGIVNQRTGAEAVPCEAVCYYELSDRFDLVCYSTGEADKDSAFGSYSVTAENEIVYFRGWGRVFDRKSGVFVSSLTFKNKASDISANAAFIFEEIENGAVKAYSAGGSLCDTYYLIKAAKHSSSFLAIKNIVDDEFLIIGKDGKVIGRIFDQIPNFEMVDGSDSILRRKRITLGTGSKDELSDLSGNIISPYYNSITDVIDDKYLIATNSEDGGFGVADFSGNVVIPFEYDDIRRCDSGLFHCLKNKKWYLFNSEGKQINPNGFDYAADLLCNFSPNNTTPVLFLNGNVLTCYGAVKTSTDGMILIGNTLYNTENGDIVLQDIESFIKLDNKYYAVGTDKRLSVYSIK